MVHAMRTRTLDGQALKEVREREGLTQAELAGEVGCHETYVNHLESGRRQPSGKLYAAMCRALKVDPHSDRLLVTKTAST
jgi:transcriptional regulator with XRE-family HTH domain